MYEICMCVCSTLWKKPKFSACNRANERNKLVYGINYILIRIESKCKAAVIDMSMCTRMSTIYSIYQVIHMNLPKDIERKKRKSEEKTASRSLKHMCVCVYFYVMPLPNVNIKKEPERKPSIEYKIALSSFASYTLCQFRISFSIDQTFIRNNTVSNILTIYIL